ncbi:hypothetical protein GCM10023350_00610 [Nocardioides endophyticus]|uniref:DUF4232 domain-containing protein n=1 Tax=Nocardioides endophyticus TaxID=1353775 RepID=A0ABP8Y5R5_9ACTN
MPALTQGPLPARVYWTRRIMVLGTALLLVFAIARMLGDSSDASSSGGDGAARLSADSSSSAATEDLSSTPSASATKKGKPGKGTGPTQTGPTQTGPTQTQSSQAPVLAQPEGTCTGSDIAVTPSVENAVGGRDVMVVLQLRTMSSPACTWRISPDTLTLGITSGDDAVWSSRECRRAIPRQDVVVRKDVTTKVGVVWKDAKRSDEECSSLTDWASPGWYHATAAALGGEPSDVQFELTTPTAATVTVTATPKQDPTKKPGKKSTKKPGKKSSDSPSGAVD